MGNSNIYKSIKLEENRMFPSDPSGSLDDFFLMSFLLNSGGWK